MEIILARHGRPDFKPDRWVAPVEMGGWIERFNRAGIGADAAPAATAARAAASSLIVSSSLTRSIQSARRLAGGREVLTEDLFCEAGLPWTSWRAPRLPFGLWIVVFRLAWFWGFFGHAESRIEFEARASAAAQRLLRLARERGSVFLVGHGIMNGWIARQLQAQGAAGARRGPLGYWQFKVYAVDSATIRGAV